MTDGIKKELLPHQKSKGIPVKPGQTFKDLSKEQRDAYFQEHENKWKSRYNANRGTQQTFSRG